MAKHRQEGQHQCIKISDTPSCAVSLFLKLLQLGFETFAQLFLWMDTSIGFCLIFFCSCLLTFTHSDTLSAMAVPRYTSSLPETPTVEVTLLALDLAHRWQVEEVVTILSEILEGMIRSETFAVIAEAASLKHLETLLHWLKIAWGKGYVKYRATGNNMQKAIPQFAPLHLIPASVLRRSWRIHVASLHWNRKQWSDSWRRALSPRQWNGYWVMRHKVAVSGDKVPMPTALR